MTRSPLLLSPVPVPPKPPLNASPALFVTLFERSTVFPSTSKVTLVVLLGDKAA